MSTSLQFRRGTTVQNAAFRGAPGELSVDTELWQIRIHDGVNYGGHVIQGGGGTQGITSVAFSTGTTGLTVSNSPVTPTSNNPITLAGTLSKANGGTGVSNPNLIAGTNITITGTWPNQTITASSGATGNVTAGTNITVTGTWPDVRVGLTGIVAIANGGTGTANPVISAGSGVTVTGTWPNVTIAGTSTGARGGGVDKVFWENDKVITADYTVSTDKNAMTAGPVTVNTGVTVIVPTGSSWSIV